MATIFRRLFWLALLGGAGFAGWTAYQRNDDEAPSDAPEWPPLDPPTPDQQVDAFATTITEEAPLVSEPNPEAIDPPLVQADATLSDVLDEPVVPPRWADPIDDDCPDGYPIKANDNSGIFHVPGGRFYDRTVPERCYANAADAEADGYRQAKA